MSKAFYLVSYDISLTKRRNKLARVMEGKGRRVQYSVFECRLDRGELEDLLRKAAPHICEEEGDSLRVYALCGACAQKILCLGAEKEIWEDVIVV